jgi:hypothetical protein
MSPRPPPKFRRNCVGYGPHGTEAHVPIAVWRHGSTGSRHIAVAKAPPCDDDEDSEVEHKDE